MFVGRCRCIMLPLLSGILTLVLSSTGCQAPLALDTLDGLATALEREGIPVQTRETIDLSPLKSAEVKEGLALVGDGLRIEILRIDDEHSFGLAERVGTLYTVSGLQAEGGGRKRPVIFSRHPYVVVVRQEPRDGQVLRALEKLLPAGASQSHS